jgi:16S rRNA G966 N2-methylase RsmD
VDRLLEAVDLPGGVWLDAGAGEGQILRAVKAIRDDIVWTAVEVREECRESLEKETTVCTITDFTKMQEVDFLKMLRRVSHKPKFDVVIMNPPFNQSFAFLQGALSVAEHVVMLQRLNYLGSQERSSFFQQHMPDTYILPDRPIFTGNHGDSIEYAWFHFSARHSLPELNSKGIIQMLASTPIDIRSTKKRSKKPTKDAKMPQLEAKPAKKRGRKPKVAPVEETPVLVPIDQAVPRLNEWNESEEESM